MGGGNIYYVTVGLGGNTNYYGYDSREGLLIGNVSPSSDIFIFGNPCVLLAFYSTTEYGPSTFFMITTTDKAINLVVSVQRLDSEARLVLSESVDKDYGSIYLANTLFFQRDDVGKVIPVLVTIQKKEE